ncbi:MAG: L-threonylcarbamoyladenylate synthase [Ancalomicrobiaceae bacterium]|nr:L-threonylcarbamoyladenylate synthase [Ancalomicrobiaceae bacterium]
MQRFDLKDGGVPSRERAITAAVAALDRGRLVAVPTETVYGLAADATNAPAVAGIYAAKGRPSFNPLIAHVCDIDMAMAHGILSPLARQLAGTFWPGPLTLVVPRRVGAEASVASIADLVTAGLETIALRMPANGVTLDVIRRLGRPIAAPSANRSGGISATSADDVIAELGPSVSVVLDDGASPVGVESTIVLLAEAAPRLLRPGGVPREAIERAIGQPLADNDHEPDDPQRPLAPGMLTSHYAPNARVRLDVTALEPGEAFLGFGPFFPEGLDKAVASANLSATGNVVEAACNLFRLLRELDRSGAAAIAVAPVPGGGLAEAIRDRLGRAAAPRR